MLGADCPPSWPHNQEACLRKRPPLPSQTKLGVDPQAERGLLSSSPPSRSSTTTRPLASPSGSGGLRDRENNDRERVGRLRGGSLRHGSRCPAVGELRQPCLRSSCGAVDRLQPTTHQTPPTFRCPNGPSAAMKNSARLLGRHGHEFYVKEPAWSPDGTLLASTSGDTTIRRGIACRCTNGAHSGAAKGRLERVLLAVNLRLRLSGLAVPRRQERQSAARHRVGRVHQAEDQ